MMDFFFRCIFTPASFVNDEILGGVRMIFPALPLSPLAIMGECGKVV